MTTIDTNLHYYMHGFVFTIVYLSKQQAKRLRLCNVVMYSDLYKIKYGEKVVCNGSIDEFNKYNLTSTYMGTWPQLHFDEWVTAHLIEFHTSYGPWMEDYERILCHFMRYSSTLKSIQNIQRKPFYDLFGKSISLIMRIRYDIINKIDNENINNIHVECKKIYNINLEQCIYLLNCFLKDTKAVIKKRELKLLKQSALKNANLWICKVCNKMVYVVM
eukprot:347975_1